MYYWINNDDFKYIDLGVYLLSNRNIQIVEDLVLTEIDGEAVLLSIKHDTYFGLDELGLQIWKWIQENENMEDIKKNIKSLYQVENQILEQDLNRFLNDLKEKGLITW